jgi:hypothetical protein
VNDSPPNFLFRNRGDGTSERSAFSAGAAVNENGTAVSSMARSSAITTTTGTEDLFVTALSNEMFSFPKHRQGTLRM